MSSSTAGSSAIAKESTPKSPAYKTKVASYAARSNR